MESIRIRVTDTPNSNVWFNVGEIYEVNPITRPLTRYGGKIVQAYYLIDNDWNRKMHRCHVHSGMCIGEDCVIIVGDYKTNMDARRLLSQD